MATLMPFAKAYGAIAGFCFGFLSIFMFDAAAGAVGQWTIITGVAYGLIGVLASFFFAKWNTHGIREYVIFSIFATLLYDAATGLSIGPLFFHQPFMDALLGQIPFTLYHLGGNIILAAIASPFIERWLLKNPKLESDRVMERMRALFV